MNTFRPSPLHFSGYQVIPGEIPEKTKARIFSPGPADNKHPIQAHILKPSAQQPETIPLRYDAQSQLWKSETLPLGTDYQLDVPSLPVLEATMGPQRQPLALKRTEHFWQSSSKVPAGTTVRLPMDTLPTIDVQAVFPDGHTQPLQPTVEGSHWVIRTSKDWREGVQLRVQVAPDWVEVVHRNGQRFNRISTLEANAPQKNGPLADIFLDSLLPLEGLAQLTGLPAETLDKLSPSEKRQTLSSWVRDNADKLPGRNHFNVYGGNETGLQEMLPLLHRTGIRSILTKPFIGGDNLSSHRYWTVDPYVLNSSFSSKPAFKQFLNQALDHSMKLYNDGAFVNQGLQGVQFYSLLANPKGSPYWHWFNHSEKIKDQRIDHQGKLTLPRLWHDSLTLGVLPTKLQSNGHRILDLNHVAFRVVNDPDTPGYNRKKPTWLELYDPTRETKDGQALSSDRLISSSEDSVQTLRFPISLDELAEKKKQLSGLDDLAQKRLMLTWQNFRLTEASLDDSTYKWNGQIDVAKMNTNNPDVQEYLQNAVSYWTRSVNNVYIARVAKALHEAKETRPNASYDELIQSITNPSEKPNPAYALPKVELLELETLTPKQMEKALEKPHNVNAERLPQALASSVLKQYPLMALELPIPFKSLLSYPDVPKLLQGTASDSFMRFVRERLQKGMAKLPVAGKPFENFEQRFAQRLGQVVEQLPAESRDKLTDPRLQKLLLDDLGEAVMMQIFTGLDIQDPKVSKSLTPDKVEDAFYQTVPARILKNNPVSASKLLPGFMKKRLKQIDTDSLAQWMHQQLNALDADSVAMARAVLNQREFGLNWRLDAAKDVADMDHVFNAEPQDRAKLFQQEMNVVRPFWKQLNRAIQSEFPKASIIAELTDFEMLSNDDVAVDEMAKTLASGDINGTPNMRFLFAPLMEVINHSQRPDEYGGKTISPTEFMLNAAKASSQAYPNPAVRNNQNMTSSHDFLTTAHSLLLNSDIWTMDHLKWWGLSDDLQEASRELLTKPCFEDLRQSLDAQVPNWQQALRTLQQKLQKPNSHEAWLQSEAMQARLKNPQHQAFFNENTKSGTDGRLLVELSKLNEKELDSLFQVISAESIGLNNQQLQHLKSTIRQGSTDEMTLLTGVKSLPNPGEHLWKLRTQVQNLDIKNQLSPRILKAFELAQDSAFNIPTPFELKESFADDLLKNAIAPNDLGLSQQQMSILANALTSRMSEHSEDRAMRAVIVNNWQQLISSRQWQTVTQQFGLDDAASEALKQTLTQALWKALDDTIQVLPPRQFGMLPLDMALTKVFERLDRSVLPEAKQQAALLRELQQALYAQANAPVMDKLLRIFAIQNALPGNPSVYLQDLFAQSGGEWTKNMFLQDRNLIRTDRLQTESWLQEYVNSAAEIFGKRSQLPALTNGHLIPVTPDDAKGVLPIVRDNGTDQVITLVNTGRAQAPNWDHGKVGKTEHYTDIPSRTPILHNYKANLSELHITPGTTYRDINSNERFIINEVGQLVSKENPEQGLELKVSRSLQRENKRLERQG